LGGAPSTAVPAASAVAPVPQPLTKAYAPVALLSFVLHRRTEMPAEDTMEGGNDIEINMSSPEPLVWYSSIGPDKVRKAPRILSGIEEHLNKITTGIRKCNDAAIRKMAPDPAEFLKINDRIHRAFFLDINAMTIRVKRLLHNDSGLPAIFTSTTVDYP
jgi:hypothetical protein